MDEKHEEKWSEINCLHVFNRYLSDDELRQHKKDHEDGKCPGKYPDEV